MTVSCTGAGAAKEGRRAWIPGTCGNRSAALTDGTGCGGR